VQRIHPVAPGAGVSVPPTPSRGPIASLLGWSRRRWALAAVAFAVLVVLFGPLVAPAGQPRWAWPAAVLLALPGALIVASYLPEPGTGRRLDIGCTPCAVVAVGAVVMALLLRSGAPADLGRTALCVLMLGIGLHQRLLDPARCPTGTPAADGKPAA
jgi:hypothetical protein